MKVLLFLFGAIAFAAKLADLDNRAHALESGAAAHAAAATVKS